MDCGFWQNSSMPASIAKSRYSLPVYAVRQQMYGKSRRMSGLAAWNSFNILFISRTVSGPFIPGIL